MFIWSVVHDVLSECIDEHFTGTRFTDVQEFPVLGATRTKPT